MEHHVQNPSERAKYNSMTPLGSLVSFLVQRLAWEDPLVRPLADYFRLAGLWGFGAGEMILFDVDVYTTETRERVIRDGLSTSAFWDEWSLAQL